MSAWARLSYTSRPPNETAATARGTTAKAVGGGVARGFHQG
jgi:hypothetical protein